MAGTYIEIPVESGGGGSGITTLNGLTNSSQSFAVGTAGTNFTIASSGTTHTFNIPIASASNTGLLSAADWSTFSAGGNAITALTGDVTATGPGSAAATIAANAVTTTKIINSAVTNAKLANMVNNTVKGNTSGGTSAPSDLALSDVAEATSSVLTITNGSKSIVGASNLTIQVKRSSTTVDGYLAATDFVTFNNKQAAGNYITALTGDATASGPGSAALTLATVNGNVGSFGTATQVGAFTVNGKGLITAAANTAIQIAESQVTNLVTDLAAKQSTTLTNTHILVGNASNVATDVALSGDATLANTGSVTLATVNSNVGSFGTASNVSTVTLNAKGLVTAGSNTPIQIAESQVTNLVSDLAAKASSTLTSAHLLVGNGSNVATDVAASGDVTLANTGAFTVVTVGGQTSAAVATAATQVSAATASATANTLVLRSVNANISVNSTNQAVATTVTAAGTTTLTTASAPHQQFTGTTTQIVQLLDATTTINGKEFTVFNRSTGIVTVNNNGGSLVSTVAPNSQRVFTLINNGTTNGVWDVGAVGFADISGSISSSNGMLAQTASGTYTGRTLTGTAGDIVVTNGDGIAGNPTFDIGTSVVTLTGSQSLSNKTLASAILSGTTNANNTIINSVKSVSFNGEVDDGNSSTAATIDWTTGAVHKILMTGSCTFTFTAPANPTRLQLKLTQNGTGNFTASWPAAVKWPSAAPIITAAANAIDIVTFWYDGTNYFAVDTQNFV